MKIQTFRQSFLHKQRIDCRARTEDQSESRTRQMVRSGGVIGKENNAKNTARRDIRKRLKYPVLKRIDCRGYQTLHDCPRAVASHGRVSLHRKVTAVAIRNT